MNESLTQQASSCSPLQFLSYQQGVLFSEKVPLIDIAEKVGTPVYIYSTDAFMAPLQQLQAGLQGLDYLICFAVKSNSNLSVLKLIADAGVGMDVVSGGELFRAQKVSGVGKSVDEMISALQYQGKGIYSFNVESIDELVTLNKVASNFNKKVQVALRFNPDVDPQTHPYISTGLKKNKFGMDRSEILQIVSQLSQLQNIQLGGISIHIGSQLLSLSPFEDAFKILSDLIEEVQSKMGTPLRFVDLGGGVGISYKDEEPPALEKYCKLVKRFFGKDSKFRASLKILIEPGRVISGNAGILLTRVLYRKERQEKDFVIVDAAMNDLIRPALYESYHEIVPIKQMKASSLRPTTVVGPVCESSDCFGENRALSAEILPGDCLAVLSAGAYGFAMASNYNTRPRPPEVLVQGDSFRIIREREKYEEMLRLESQYLL
jgi:diaminopimelate decarboxylase